MSSALASRLDRLMVFRDHYSSWPLYPAAGSSIYCLFDHQQHIETPKEFHGFEIVYLCPIILAPVDFFVLFSRVLEPVFLELL